MAVIKSFKEWLRTLHFEVGNTYKRNLYFSVVGNTVCSVATFIFIFLVLATVVVSVANLIDFSIVGDIACSVANLVYFLVLAIM